MKVTTIQTGYNIGLIRQRSVDTHCANTVSFGIGNCGDLKRLFTYGLPCMYSGVEMIDPQKAQRLVNSSAFKQSSRQALAILKEFEPKIIEPELSIYNIIKAQAQKEPEKNLQQVLKSVEPSYKKRLRTDQAPIFENLKNLAQDLPEKYQYKFNQLMAETYDKLKDRPIAVPFSANEFQYKLDKVCNDIRKTRQKRSVKATNKMMNESVRLNKTTDKSNLEHQKKIISYISILAQRYNLSPNPQLQGLFDEAQSRLNGEKILVPFSRKAFIYDLKMVLDGLKNKDLYNEMVAVAATLPTSTNSIPAAILKYAADPPEKIAYRILWASYASVEHILPQSCGGKDEMANFGGATTKENSMRKSIKFTEQMKRKPNIQTYCQNYVNRLISYIKKGVFSKNNISTKYVDDFISTIHTQSEGQLQLDKSELTSYRQKGNAILSLLNGIITKTET